MPRSDKKNRTCDRCGKECANPNKLREHLNRKFKCKPKPIRPKSPELQPPPRPRSPSPVLIDHVRGRDRRKEKPKVVNPIPDLQVVTPTPVPKTESQRDAPVLGRDYITEEEAKNWVNPNVRKSGEHYKTWGKRLVQKWKELDLGDHDMPENLHQCHTLCHDLELYDPDAVRPLTLKELESKGDPEHKNLINKEFERLREIKGYERLEKDLEFREQEELGIAVKRKAIAVHRAKVSKSYPDNGSDIQKMLESRRKQFREILEKEFEKRGQFKFALCSLTKFLIDDKPGKEK